MDIYTIFLTGLLTGGLSCMAVQGGLLAATLAQREQEHLKNKSLAENNLFPILSFLIAKIFAYTLLGFFLGFAGSVFHLSIAAQVILDLAIAIFMIGTALDILKVHPVFRYFVIQPPGFLLRLLKNQTRSKDIFAPALVGAATIFIPCGTTQAMMALALGSGNPYYSATILFAFTLGTAPVFFLLGLLTTKLNAAFQKVFMKIVAFAVIILALFNINNALILSGSRYTLSYLIGDFSCTALSICLKTASAQSDNQPVKEATIYFNSDGYTPSSITVPKNSRIKLNLVNRKAGGCIQAFVIPKLNVQKIVRTGTSETIAFDSPGTPQDVRFTCSMGMYGGVIHVV